MSDLYVFMCLIGLKIIFFEVFPLFRLPPVPLKGVPNSFKFGRFFWNTSLIYISLILSYLSPFGGRLRGWNLIWVKNSTPALKGTPSKGGQFPLNSKSRIKRKKFPLNLFFNQPINLIHNLPCRIWFSHCQTIRSDALQSFFIFQKFDCLWDCVYGLFICY